MRKIAFAAIAVVLLIGMTAVAQNVSIQLDGNTFKVVGWKVPAVPPARGWSSIFVIYAGVGDVPALLGTYAIAEGTLVFYPRFPISSGVQYRAVFQPPGGASIERSFEGPRRDTVPRARVANVYPSGDVLPINQLRLYIYFSEPMSRGEAFRHVRILDENGKLLEGNQAVFLPGEELWDPGFQRLTLTFDPGRIKRGLTSNESIGPPIAEGKRYALVIERDWPDARGVPMVESFQKTFRGGPAERVPPDPRKWHLTAPKAGSNMALVVDFPTPMNYPLLQRMLQIMGSHGRVEGTIRIDRQETQWRFTPREPWQPGDYRLVVDAAIEDLAGNHVGQPFDIDTFERVTQHIDTTTVSVPFKVR